MTLIPAKGVIIITQGLELPQVPSTQQLAASFSNALPIMAGHLELMVSGNNAVNIALKRFDHKIMHGS
jgi:hypothetical protein